MHPDQTQCTRTDGATMGLTGDLAAFITGISSVAGAGVTNPRAVALKVALLHSRRTSRRRGKQHHAIPDQS